jgi:hypothetical protein
MMKANVVVAVYCMRGEAAPAFWLQRDRGVAWTVNAAVLETRRLVTDA